MTNMIEQIVSPMTLIIAIAVGIIFSFIFLLACFSSGYAFKKFSVVMFISMCFIVFAIGFLITIFLATLIFGMQDISEVFESEFLK